MSSGVGNILLVVFLDNLMSSEAVSVGKEVTGIDGIRICVINDSRVLSD